MLRVDENDECGLVLRVRILKRGGQGRVNFAVVHDTLPGRTASQARGINQPGAPLEVRRPRFPGDRAVGREQRLDARRIQRFVALQQECRQAGSSFGSAE